MTLTVTIPTIYSASCSDLQSETIGIAVPFSIAVNLDLFDTNNFEQGHPCTRCKTIEYWKNSKVRWDRKHHRSLWDYGPKCIVWTCQTKRDNPKFEQKLLKGHILRNTCDTSNFWTSWKPKSSPKVIFEHFDQRTTLYKLSKFQRCVSMRSMTSDRYWTMASRRWRMVTVNFRVTVYCKYFARRTLCRVYMVFRRAHVNIYI